MEKNANDEIVSWVKQIFKDRNYDKLDFKFPDQYDSSGGYVAEIAFVSVTAEKDGVKENFELAIKSARSEVIASFSHEMFSNEVMVYADLIPCLNKFAETRKATLTTNVPRCYGTLTGKDYYVIILENLKSKGFKINNMQLNPDATHVELLLKAYARWHARSMALRDQERKVFDKYDKLTQVVKDCPVTEYATNMFINEFDFVLNFYKERNIIQMVEKLSVLRNKFGDLLHECMNYKNYNFSGMIHGDCWFNNFLFHYDENSKIPDDVVIIDWQCAFVGPPMVDVTHILFCNCSRAELENLDDLLHLYYTTLSETLLELGSDPDKCFPWNVCLESFKQYAPIGIVAMATSAKISFTKKPSKTPNFADIKENKNFSAAVGTELSDPEGFFDRVDGILQLAIEKEYI